MWCLWNLGLLGEPLLGPFGLVAVYVLTGIAGNLLSNTWDVLAATAYASRSSTTAAWARAPPGPSSASPASSSSCSRITSFRSPGPNSNACAPRSSDLPRSISSSVSAPRFPSRLIGVRIDNLAHIGGFLSGLALGPGLISAMTLGRARYLGRQKAVFLTAAFLLSLYSYGLANLK